MIRSGRRGHAVAPPGQLTFPIQETDGPPPPVNLMISNINNRGAGSSQLPDYDPVPEQDLSISVEELEILAADNTKKPRKSKKAIDGDHRSRKRAKQEQMENDLQELRVNDIRKTFVIEQLEAKIAKMKAKRDRSQEEKARWEAQLESKESERDQREKYLALIKKVEDRRQQAVSRLEKLIPEGVDFVSKSKDDLWEEIWIDGQEVFNKFWEENQNYKNELMSIAELSTTNIQE